MTSAAQLAANRRNARHSTGPRTAAGKARVAQNARRHGLSCAIVRDCGWSEEIKALARAIAGPDAGARRAELACRVAAAQIDLVRARRARRELLAGAWREGAGSFGQKTFYRRLAAFDDYEGRALARRKSAIRDFDALS